ncbi:Serine/Threonine-Protein Kinase Nek4 [Manis pentadactyla]|nr:Serine/Threonine-Protein Kinase Nek4 [Manis pentadactyla]
MTCADELGLDDFLDSLRTWILLTSLPRKRVEQLWAPSSECSCDVNLHIQRPTSPASTPPAPVTHLVCGEGQAGFGSLRCGIVTKSPKPDSSARCCTLPLARPVTSFKEEDRHPDKVNDPCKVVQWQVGWAVRAGASERTGGQRDGRYPSSSHQLKLGRTTRRASEASLPAPAAARPSGTAPAAAAAGAPQHALCLGRLGSALESQE